MNTKKKLSVALAFACASIVLSTAMADDKTTGMSKRAPISETVLETSSVLIEQLSAKWDTVLRQGYGLSDAAMQQFKSGYASYPASVLMQALDAKSFDVMNNILLDHNQTLVSGLADRYRQADDSKDVSAHQTKASMRKALGDEAKDLVYIPITPCRTFDTRATTFIGFGGQVTQNNPKNAFVTFSGPTSSWIAYGGTVDSCPDTTQTGGPLGGTFPYAAAVNISTIFPSADGWITAYRGDLPDPSNTVVTNLVKAGTLQTALAIVNVCRGVTGASCPSDIKIASQATAVHVAGDVVGYFIKPQATALQCTAVNGVTASVPANTYTSVNVAACPAGYTSIGVDFSTGANVLKADSGFGYLYVRNVDSIAQNVTAKTTCCRIPGR
jgi:hypothetical protein